MRKFLLFISIIILLTSCITQRRCAEKFPPQVSSNKKDSVVFIYREIRKDSLVPVNDTALIEMLVKCDSAGKVYLSELIKYKTGKLVVLPEISLKNNKLQVRCNVDSIRVYTIFKERLSFVKTAVKQTEIVKANGLTKFQKIQIKLFWVYSGIAITALILFILKFYIKW